MGEHGGRDSRTGRRTWPALEVGAPAGEAADWDLIQASLTDFAVAAIDEAAPDLWRVFFHTPEDRQRAVTALHCHFPTLTLAHLDVPDEDWAAKSQASLRSIRVGNLIVAPPWDNKHGTDAITVVIQPSMGFGTGHHATTRLCLTHLQELELPGRNVIDVGTGSGILAIAAARLGAAGVLAIDDDEDAIQSARENVGLNPGVEVTVGTLDVRAARLRPFDVLLANLTGALLIGAAGRLADLVQPQGRLVLSGFMTAEAEQVLAAFGSCTIERRSQEDEWVCVTLLRSR